MAVLRKGSKGDDVIKLQRLLGFDEKDVDGIFGNYTDKAVREFQASHGLVADGIVGPKTWEALASDIVLGTSKRTINEIIVHCSATAEGMDYTVADITRWHKARGFTTIGYHYVVYRDGSIHVGRDINMVGAHCTGHNAHSIGVCYIGGCAADGKTPKDTRTDAQKQSLVTLLTALRRLYPKATIHGHREFAAKACPSFNAKEEYKNI